MAKWIQLPRPPLLRNCCSSKRKHQTKLYRYTLTPPEAPSLLVCPHVLFTILHLININRSRHIRYYELYSLPNHHNLHRHGRVNGISPSLRWLSRPTILPPTLVDNDTSAVWRILWTGIGYRHPRERDPADPGSVEQDLPEPFDKGAYSRRD